MESPFLMATQARLKIWVWLIFPSLSSLWRIGSVWASEPPQDTPSPSVETQAVELGKPAIFTISEKGPFMYQWKFDGKALAGQTNAVLIIPQAQESDEGDYTVLITNRMGSIESAPARLWVVPSSNRFVKANFTNNGSRLPYFYLLPANYDAGRKYPLLLWLHGATTDESTIVPPLEGSVAVRYLAESPGLKVFASGRRQQTDPTIVVWPTRRAGDRHWTEDYLQLITNLIDRVCLDFSVDTDRMYLGAASEGVHAAWDLAATRQGFFAGAIFLSGWSGRASPESLKDLAVWVFHAATDAVVDVRHSQVLVESLQRAGGSPRYTELKAGTHASSILAGITTPAVVDWLAAQRRGKTRARPAEGSTSFPQSRGK